MAKLSYKTAEEMQNVIDKYFLDCEGVPLRDDDGSLVYDKFGQLILVGRKPPTVTGLALALGFNSRQTLLNYQARKTFMDTVTRAKSRVEEYTEMRLFDRDGAMGAKFSLSNNFKGWSEKSDIEVKTGNTVLKSILDQLEDGE